VVCEIAVRLEWNIISFVYRLALVLALRAGQTYNAVIMYKYTEHMHVNTTVGLLVG